ncbi:MAG: hydrogenase/urease nickel incorporation protein HypA [Sulfurimonadaceae bacterium]|jgi:hydrogenase nickel incorporation protein HypA/HybF|nr:hydrogenase/urease nickel incorporation protein HypA [Sulfurimonadaceae bacterium]
MHEYSIVQSLIDTCEAHAKENNAKRVTKVVLKIGVMSGIEPQLLQTAFDTFKEETICHDAELVLNVQKVLVMCKTCHKESTLEKFEYLCGHCKSIELDIVDGEEMYLMQLELEENE